MMRQGTAQGFSLLEMTVVLIIMSIVASAAIPQLIQGYAINAANKTALDMAAIEEASRKFYIDNNSWPANIAVLQAGNYLPSTWQAVNPFGLASSTPATYGYTLSANASFLTVSTYVPASALSVIQNLLPLTTVSANTINSSIAVPGTLSVMPAGSIVAWSSTSIPSGFLLCDGNVYATTSYPSLATVLGSSFGGNGTSTFAVPDLRGRFVVGFNALTTADTSNRIWSMDSYSNNQGKAVSYSVNQIGGVLGEEKHRQTSVELAPHNHQINTLTNLSGGNNAQTVLPYNGIRPYTFTTSTTGGNNDASGLGAGANVVAPSVVLVYIIKY